LRGGFVAVEMRATARTAHNISAGPEAAKRTLWPGMQPDGAKKKSGEGRCRYNL